MIRRILIPLCAVLLSAPVWGQMPGGEASAVWSAKISPAQDSLLEVVFEARITPGWHIYDLGPYEIPSMATGFDFSSSSGLELVGKPYQKEEPVRKFDEIFGFDVGYFEGTARFAQKVRPLKSGAVLAGEVEYQICKDEVGCIRGVWEFSIAAGAVKGAVKEASKADAKATKDVVGGSKAAKDVAENAAEAAENDRNNENETEASAVPPVHSGRGGSLWGMILEAILWGFAALLTPCVFPMVPMTVSFFLKGDQNRALARFRALVFGLLIVALYTLPIAVVILVTRFAGGEAVTADIFNWLSTHWIPNILFFLVFMLFAAALLGAFEMTMPSKLVNRSDRGADKKGLAGLFFLALTLVLVSFSCTGPIVGTVLIKSTQGEFWAPILTMLVFSTAFALPFTLLAFFPGLIARLPKSGSWLGSVKVILGFVEIALGLKFLSVADQTYHWGILPREVYLAIWIVVFSLLGFYLLGKIRFKYDSPVEHIGVGRLALAILTFSFVVWLIPGMWGAPLKAISGYLPPLIENVAERSNISVSGGVREDVKYADILHLPHGMEGYFDFEQGMARAREENKPVFLDFTGHGCVNCREMEARVWVDPEVRRILREEYVVIALYSDDRTRLSEADLETTPSGREMKTLGRKNSYLINTRYGVSSQPAYLLLDGAGELLVPVRGYNLDIPAFVEFLRGGIITYKNGRP